MKNEMHDHAGHQQKSQECRHSHEDHASNAEPDASKAGASQHHPSASSDKPYTDPVCGMSVADRPNRRIEHEGVRYHFCSAKCMDKFRVAPASYIEKGDPAAMPEALPGTIYTCPMHPEIQQPTPGNCPICGMSLEPMLPSLEDDENPELVDFRRRFRWTLPLTVAVAILAMAGHRIFSGVNRHEFPRHSRAA